MATEKRASRKAANKLSSKDREIQKFLKHLKPAEVPKRSSVRPESLSPEVLHRLADRCEERGHRMIFEPAAGVSFTIVQP